jgi:hypothetical protein
LGRLKAFARGRRTKNLYYDVIPTEEALNMKITELKEILSLDKYPKNTRPAFVDLILFIPLISVGTIYSILSLILLPFVIVYSIYISKRLRFCNSDMFFSDKNSQKLNQQLYFSYNPY